MLSAIKKCWVKAVAKAGPILGLTGRRDSHLGRSELILVDHSHPCPDCGFAWQHDDADCVEERARPAFKWFSSKKCPQCEDDLSYHERGELP